MTAAWLFCGTTATVRQKARLPEWVNLAVLAVGRSLPVYPKKQTFTVSVGRSQSAQTRPLGCRPESGWNLEWRILRSHEGIVSGGKVNWLIDGFCGERLPTIDLAHVDLPGCK